MWIKFFFGAGVLIFLAVCVESFREGRKFRVTDYDMDIPAMKEGGEEQKIVFLSDLHNHVYGENNDRLLESIRSQEPDLILIGGDMLIGKRDTLPDPALDFVKQLPQIAPVYYCNGNHEQRMKEDSDKYGNIFFDYKEKLLHAGIRFLENTSEVVDLGQLKVRLTGVELPKDAYQKFQMYPLKKKEIEALVGSSEPDCFQILLAHNPIYFQTYKEWGADLVLSGHLHGGVARIPGGRGVITPQAFLFPKYSGEMTTEEGKTMIVSKGLGTHTVKFRIFNSPEVVVIHLHPCKNPEVLL